MTQTGVCIVSGGPEIDIRVNDEQVEEAHGIQVFAGPRLEPFFINLAGAQETEALEHLAFKAKGRNAAEGLNVLSIVVRLDPETVFGPRSRPLLAVVGETGTSGGHPVRIERMGRPEIKNVIMQARKFDTVNRDLEIRDLYNAEDAFSLSHDYEGAYRAGSTRTSPSSTDSMARRTGRSTIRGDTRSPNCCWRTTASSTRPSRSRKTASSRSNAPCSAEGSTPRAAAGRRTTTSSTSSTRSSSEGSTEHRSATVSIRPPGVRRRRFPTWSRRTPTRPTHGPARRGRPATRSHAVI